jgi:hypothetical protein
VAALDSYDVTPVALSSLQAELFKDGDNNIDECATVQRLRYVV